MCPRNGRQLKEKKKGEVSLSVTSEAKSLEKARLLGLFDDDEAGEDEREMRCGDQVRSGRYRCNGDVKLVYAVTAESGP